MKGRPIRWSAEELAWIEARAGQPRPAVHAAFVARFGRPDVSLANLVCLCKRRGWAASGDGRFRPGQTPVNKGRKGFAPAGSEKGWFRPGVRSGRAAALHKPIGTERVSRDGYLERKVNDDRPFNRRWRAVHLLNWEAAHGPVPEGCALKCLDGDRLNTDPSNWVAIPRGMLPRLNGHYGRDFDAAPADLKPLLLRITQLEHAAREARRARKRSGS